MQNALNVVNMLLETQIMRVCAQCEQEYGAQPVQPGVQKSHGLCRRHAYAAYAEAGLGPENVAAMSSDQFPPDLSESVDASTAQRFAQDSGLTLHPELQYGSMAANQLSLLSPDQQKQMQTLASWEFTDRRPESPTRSLTFYSPVNASYEQIAELWDKKLEQERQASR